MRQALNVTYALIVEGMDSEQRERFDADLNGWSEQAKLGTARLTAMLAQPADQQ